MVIDPSMYTVSIENEYPTYITLPSCFKELVAESEHI